MDQAKETIFGPIGMTLSGGGYRAAAFHLGTIDYLERIGALSHLRTLSTVSGGTFTGAKYVLSLIRGEAFEDFFAGYYCQLRDVNLVKLGLAQLDEKPDGIPSGRRDLIVSMAHVYAQTFFGDGLETATFDEILDADIGIKEIIFNSTEFRTGVAFRFQTSIDDKGLIGNGNISISRETARQIRVADIVAASSCFPGGFEPFAFPQDFVWPGGIVPQELHCPAFEKPLPLMDGGVYDNQGIDSLLLAEERTGEEFDLVIISDVDQKSDNLFPFPQTKSIGLLGRLRLRTVVWLLWLLMALSAVTVGALAVRLITTDIPLFSVVFAHIVPILLAFGTAYSIWVIRDEVKDKLLPLIPQTGSAGWKDLRRLKMDQLAEMMNLRIQSVVAMAVSIFMKRIRALGYRRIYWNDTYTKKRISNLVYHLSPGEEFAEDLEGLVRKPSSALHAVADAAANMPTTLWFEDDKPYQLPSLVACGQATMCYNLMKHVVRKYGKEPQDYRQGVRVLWDRLTVDWQSFCEEPYWLLDERITSEMPFQKPPGSNN